MATDRVAILEAAMQKTFKDPEFPPYFKKLLTEDPSPMGGRRIEKNDCRDATRPGDHRYAQEIRGTGTFAHSVRSFCSLVEIGIE